MRAVVVRRYGPPEVACVVDRPDPVPRAGDVVVRVRAAAVTSGDARIRGARFPRGFGVPARVALGLRGPRRQVLGVCFAGVVEAVGPEGGSPHGIRVGDHVAGMTGGAMGAHAELVSRPGAKLVRMPSGVSFADAAGAVFGGTTALYFLRDRAHVRPEETVLVIGASGAVGTSAVQVARHLGGVVTAVTSGRNADLVRRLGATHVVDYTAVPVDTLADRFDVVLDTVGTLSIASGRRLLAPGGRVALAVASLGEMIRARGNVLTGTATEKVEDIAFLLDLIAAGELEVVHDSSYRLDDVAEAYRRVDTGRKVGTVTLDLAPPTAAP